MNRELLLLVDALAREKNVPKDIVFTALESALASATKKRFTDEIDARVSIDRETGDYESFRRWTVVPDEEHEEPAHQLAITDAVERDPNLKIGDVVEEPLEPIEFGRTGAQAAKQVILQKIRDAEREQILNDIIPRKGVDVLVPRRPACSSGIPAWIFVAVGRVPVGAPADYLASCTELAVRLGIGERFRFVGFRADVRAAVRDFDVLVLPSHQEPFGRSIIEAMALGAPVVASRVGGVPEIIVDGRDGLLVAPGSEEELAGAIGRLLDEPGQRGELARRGRERVERGFDVVGLSRRIEALLLEDLGRAQSNLAVHNTGRQLWEREVRPSRVGPEEAEAVPDALIWATRPLANDYSPGSEAMIGQCL